MRMIRHTAGILLMAAGAIALIAVILSFTTLPFHAWYRLAKKSSAIHRPPDCIVVMGGGGMPGESALMRCWYAAEAARRFSQAKVIIALPGDTADSTSSIAGMKNELVLRGVASGRIGFEHTATNTRAQAINIMKRFSDTGSGIKNGAEKVNSPSLLLVTSPGHLHRAVLAFRKAGFMRVDGQAAWERSIESELAYRDKNLGGRRFIPEIGDNLSLRYNFWTQLNYELLVLREWTALGYYKLKGWI